MWCLLSVLNGKLTNYAVTKSSSDNFPTFPRTVLFVRRRKRAIFNVEYLGVVLMKSCKTLDYDYFDYNLLFWVKIKPGPILLHLTFKVLCVPWCDKDWGWWIRLHLPMFTYILLSFFSYLFNLYELQVRPILTGHVAVLD